MKKGKFDGNPIDTANLSSGVYFVVVEIVTGSKIVYKMIKKIKFFKKESSFNKEVMLLFWVF